MGTTGTHSIAVHDVPCNRAAQKRYGETLDAARCERASWWNRHKEINQKMQAALGGTLLNKAARDLSACSESLLLELLNDGARSARPFSTCKRRWCPICEATKSAKRFSQMLERLPGVVNLHAPLSILMLTLTVRNVSLNELPAEVDKMLKAFSKLIRRKNWPAVGYIRSVEITYPRLGEAHPHIHVMIAVKPSYFSRGYLRKSDWVNAWRQCAGLDYDPVVDIRRAWLKKELSFAQGFTQEIKKAISCAVEVVKYATKPADIIEAMERGDLSDVIETMQALTRRRLVECGGIFKGLYSDMKSEKNSIPDQKNNIGVFHWRSAETVYRRYLQD